MFLRQAPVLLPGNNLDSRGRRPVYRIKRSEITLPVGVAPAGAPEAAVIYSSSCEYAIRALTYLAREQKLYQERRTPDQPEHLAVPIKEVAEEEDLPPHFLAKIMQTLAKSGVLHSYKGPTGGFALAHPPGEITLYDIVEALDDLSNYDHCAVGLAECNDDVPCPLHNMWVGVRTAVLDYFRRTTLVDLATAVEEKKAISPASISD